MYNSTIRFNLFFCILSTITGIFIAYCLTNNVKIEIEESHTIVFNFNVTVLYKIFLHNLIFGIIISVLGFVSGGVLSLVLLFWNGIIFGEILNTYTFSSSITPYFIYHGLFEITALLCMGAIGLKGLDFYVNLFRYNVIRIIFPLKLFYFSIILLLIAAIIETLLISSMLT